VFFEARGVGLHLFPVSHSLSLTFSLSLSLSLSLTLSLCLSLSGVTESYYYNNDDYLIKYLDSSKYNDKEKEAMNVLVAQHRAIGTPYVCFGRGTGRYFLNDQNQIHSINFEWKLTSICPPVNNEKEKMQFNKK
jgi:hypothetical protein